MMSTNWCHAALFRARVCATTNLLEVRNGVAGLIAPIDGDAEQLVRVLQRSDLRAHVDASGALDILKQRGSYQSV